jgi:DeoR/GlpR family transcriptional regulator of sugar metabolism
MLDYIKENGSASIVTLSEEFSVSEMTVHRDLRYLETTGYVQKTHGGVIASPYTEEADHDRRAAVNVEGKERIGRATAELISNGDSLIIDASTTTQAVIPFLNPNHELSIFSTSVSAIGRLLSKLKFEVHATGGLVYKGTDSFVGPSANNYLHTIHVDKCLIGAAGICSPDGISDPISLVVDLKQHAAQAANEVIVCVDKTKFGRMSRFTILPMEQIDLVVTDAEEDTPCVQELRELGLDFLFC